MTPRVHWRLLVLAAITMGCVPVSALLDEPTDKQAVVVAEPTALEDVEPLPEAKKYIGTPAERDAVLAGLDGIWAHGDEVWQVMAGSARVYRSRDDDVIVTRQIEVIAPCMFLVTQDGEPGGHGSFVVDYRKDVQWTSGGVAAFRAQGGSASFVCQAPNIYRLEGDECDSWRFDPDTQTFELRPVTCELALALTREDLDTEDGGTWVISVESPDGAELEDVPLPKDDIIAGPGGLAHLAHNLASACGRFGTDAAGCSASQERALRDAHWEADDGTCGGARLRIELDEAVAQVLDSPSICAVTQRDSTNLFLLGEGVTLVDRPARVQAGEAAMLEFVVENTSAQAQVVRLPAVGFWTTHTTRNKRAVELGECQGLGIVGTGRRANSMEIRLDPGGSLTLAAPWIAAGPVWEGDDCEVKPLRSGNYRVELRMSDGDPSAVLVQTVRVKRP